MHIFANTLRGVRGGSFAHATGPVEPEPSAMPVVEAILDEETPQQTWDNMGLVRNHEQLMEKT